MNFSERLLSCTETHTPLIRNGKLEVQAENIAIYLPTSRAVTEEQQEVPSTALGQTPKANQNVKSNSQLRARLPT